MEMKIKDIIKRLQKEDPEKEVVEITVSNDELIISIL